MVKEILCDPLCLYARVVQRDAQRAERCPDLAYRQAGSYREEQRKHQPNKLVKEALKKIHLSFP
jgi:hypothetical protein